MNVIKTERKRSEVLMDRGEFLFKKLGLSCKIIIGLISLFLILRLFDKFLGLIFKCSNVKNSENNISACGSNKIFRMVKKSDCLENKWKVGISLKFLQKNYFIEKDMNGIGVNFSTQSF